MTINIKRIIAGFIDFLIVCFIITLISNIIISQALYMSYNSYLICFILGSFLLLLKDKVFRSSSIGKKLVKIKVITTHKTKLSFITCLKRNFTLFIWPVELLLVITKNKRLGDIWAKTEVVDEHTHY